MLEQAKAEDHRIRQELYAEGQTLLKTVRQDLDATIAELRRQAPEPSSGTFQLPFPQSDWQQAVQAVTSLAVEPPETPVASPPPLQVGDQVRVRGLNIVGRVMTEITSQGQVQVEAGNKMLTVAAADLERTAGQHAETAPAASKRARQTRRRHPSVESVEPELRLLGSTVDDALPAVEQYLDRATVQGIPRVRIIHGIGSGRLRDAIADFLRHHPLVHRFHAGDTGGGTTIVELEG